MAKQRSGLGRGLSTLMGGSFEESAPRTAKPERTRVTVDPGEIPEYDPILEPSTMRSVPHTPKPATINQTADAKKVPPRPARATEKPVTGEKKEAAKPSASASPAESQKKVEPKQETPQPTESPNQNPEEKAEAPTKTAEEASETTASTKPAQEETAKESPNSKDDVDNVVTIPIKEIEPNPNQPRTSFDKEELEELAASISREGLLQPILVRRVDKDKYQIVAGERRWQACKIAGIEEVPVILKDVTEDKAIELALIENLQRSDLNPIEEAYGYRRLMDRKRWTQAQLALAMSKGRSTIANALRLLDLPEEAQKLLFEDKIKAGHARAILSVPTAEGREKLTEKLKNEKLSVRETENIARLMSYNEKKVKPAERPTVPDSYKRVAKALRDVLNTTVRVRSAKGKNRIEIDFSDQDELDRIFEGLIAAKE